MDKPMPCFLCGTLCERDELQFGTDYCTCPFESGCTHGLCRTCNSDYSTADEE